MKNKNRCKILIAYHKPSTIIKSDIFVPIHVGRSIVKKENKDGKLSKNDKKWLSTNLIGDNTGENISDLNHFFNEMSAIFWAWKNQKELDNPEYIGLMHYRRHFIFSENNKSRFAWLNKSRVFSYEYINKEYLKMLDEKYINSLITEYDIISSHKYNANNLNDGHYYRNSKERFAVVSGTSEKWYELMEEIIKRDYPSFVNELEKLEKEPNHYLCNMFVMRKDLFDKYCEFTFDVSFKIYKEFSKESVDIWQTRAIGFLAEFLTSMFISAYKEHRPDKVKELDLTYVENPEEICFLKKISNFIFSKRRYYMYKSKTILGKTRQKQINYFNETNDLRQKYEYLIKRLEDLEINLEEPKCQKYQ